MSKTSSTPTIISPDYFSVQSPAKIRCAPCSEPDILKNKWPDALSKSTSLNLMEELRSIEYETRPILRAISENNKNVELYLRSINKRIELIALHLNSRNDDGERQDIQEITISEGGLKFNDTQQNNFEAGSCLALELILLPTHSALSLFGRITAMADDNKLIVEFINLKDIERQQLAKHVMQKQLQDKRKLQRDD